jgi:hypothetical protein
VAGLAFAALADFAIKMRIPIYDMESASAARMIINARQKARRIRFRLVKVASCAYSSLTLAYTDMTEDQKLPLSQLPAN